MGLLGVRGGAATRARSVVIKVTRVFVVSAFTFHNYDGKKSCIGGIIGRILRGELRYRYSKEAQMATYTRANAWNNGGTFANTDLLWYAKGVGAMQALALD